MTRVLVTGATGFIGNHLVKSLLDRGDEVFCLAREGANVEPLRALGAQLTPGDVTAADSLPPAVKDVDVVYHLAGRTKAHRLEDYLPVNETGVLNVVSACAQRTTPPTVVIVSSLSAAGARPDEQPRTESEPPNPVSFYGRSKRAGEIVAEAWAGRMPITIVRPPIVFGPGDNVSRGLYRSIHKMNRHFVLGLGRRVSLIYVENLSKFLIDAAERGERLPAPGSNGHPIPLGQGYYFVAEKQHPTYVEFGRLVGRAVGRPDVKVVRVPYSMMWISAAFGEAVGRLSRRSPYLGFDRAREITAGHWICSPEKAQTQLGFNSNTSLEVYFRQTAEWYASQGWLSLPDQSLATV